MNKENKTNQSSADHYTAYNEARNLMAELDIQSLPVDPFKITQQLKIELMTYTEADELFPDRITKLRNKKIDAIVCKPDYSIEEYIIFYDDSRPYERVRFTIAHEIGHVRIGHITRSINQFTRYSYNKTTDPIEQEADTFAGELLRPPILLALTGISNYYDIQQICNVSFQAANVGERQIKTVQKFMYNKCKEEIKFYANQFYDFIHQRICKNCNHYFINQNAKYCPVCGNNKIQWGRDIKMIYDGFELNENGRAKVCPKCGNEEVNPDYNICKICGTTIINRCAGKMIYYENGYEEFQSCDTIADGNARYCINCGAITTYFQQELLDPWEEEKKQKEALSTTSKLPPPPPKLVSSNPLARNKKWTSGEF